MIGVRKGIRGNLVLAILVLASVSLQCRGAPTLTVLTSFAGTNGSAPEGSLIANAAGDLFGTTTAGGVSNACSGGCGTVFRLTPPAAGKTNWKETVLTSFTGANGYDPSGSLLSDRTGNLYGTTYWGGASQGGTVFELSPPTAGQAIWKETVLVAFTGNNDGGNPAGGLIADKAGNLYGTARSSSLVPGCGFGGCGNVFELIGPPAGQSSWTENVLFTFNYSDGDGPVGNLLIDKKGNLYGTTYLGGADEFGTVFKLLPPSAGENTWTEAVLASLDCANGCEPQASLIADKAGNLYGTASDCIFLFGCGSVFELSPPHRGARHMDRNRAYSVRWDKRQHAARQLDC